MHMSLPPPQQSVRKSLKACIRHFTWSWHTLVMGTGVVSTLVNRFYWGLGSDATKVLTLLLFFLNLLCFVLVCAATLARYILFPEIWPAMLRHPTQSMFIGGFPMGAATLINIALVAHQSYGFSPRSGFLYALWGFWWLDALVSVAIAVGMLGVMIMRQHHSLGQLTALWILPVVPCIVASSTGGLLASALPSQSHVSLTTAVSMILLLISLSLSMMMLTALLLRLIIHGPPDTAFILSSFVPLGPMGQGGFSFLVTAQNLIQRDIHLGPFISASAVSSVAFSAAWLLWSMGLVWLCVGLLLITSSVRRKRVPFSLGFWGMCFPSGVFTLLTVELGNVLESRTIHYLGAIFSSTLRVWVMGILGGENSAGGVEDDDVRFSLRN
ncbi:hypothetical protein MKEN_00325900 [Mycena kentingensis (nom. inval.)]|nr:hypothetical protein MKEN_00325900 [Mycena kentingensis (nom. inval.)]